MNNKAVYVAIGLILGLMAGLAIGVSMVNNPTPPESRTMPDNRLAERPDEDTDPLDDAPEAERDPDEDPEPDDNRPSDPSPTPGGSLADAIESVKLDDPPGGNGTITGRITLRSGEGLGGVHVTAGGRYSASGNDDATLEDSVREHIRRRNWEKAAVREATSSADGRFTLSGIDPDVNYHVTPRKEGYEFDHRATGKYRFTDGDTVNFVAKPAIRLEVAVLMPDGSPADSATVSVETPEGRGMSSTRMANHGKVALSIEPGSWQISAESGDHGQYKSDPVTVTAEAGKPLGPIELTLKAKPGIVGKVTVPEIYNNPQLHAYLQMNPPSTSPEGRADEAWKREWLDDWDGYSFAFADIEPGSYRVLLYSDAVPVDWEDVTVGSAIVEVTLELPEPRREHYIPVRVLGPGGGIPSAPSFDLTCTNNSRTSRSSASAMKKGDGTWWIARRDLEDTEDWWFEVQVHTSEWGSQVKRYERKDTHVLEFRFDEPAWLTLTVPNYNEHELRDKLNWDLVLKSDPDPRSSWRRKRNDDPSPMRLGPVPPGEYRLELKIGERHGSRTIYSESLALVSGENTHATNVPRLYDLKVRVKDENAARELDVLKDGQNIARWSDDKEVEGNLVTVSNLSPGEYELRTYDGVMKVTVPTTGIVEFAPKPYDCMVIRDIAPDGRIAAIGFREGDKLFEVDGQEFDDVRVFGAQLQVSLTKESTTWSVMRNGVPTDITFNGKELMKILQSRDDDEDFDMDPGYINE